MLLEVLRWALKIVWISSPSKKFPGFKKIIFFKTKHYEKSRSFIQEITFNLEDDNNVKPDLDGADVTFDLLNGNF